MAKRRSAWDRCNAAWEKHRDSAGITNDLGGYIASAFWAGWWTGRKDRRNKPPKRKAVRRD